MSREARLELAEFVRSSDENHVDGIDAPAHLIRCGDLNEYGADNHADHVGGANEKKSDQREYKTVRKAEENGEEAKAGYAPLHD